MVYRQAPDTKVYVLICRDLMTNGYYMVQGHVIVSTIAENIDEAVKKLQVEPTLQNSLTMPVINGYRMVVKMPKTPPEWFKSRSAHWQKLLNPKLLWEVNEVGINMLFFEGTRKKIKIKSEV